MSEELEQKLRQIAADCPGQMGLAVRRLRDDAPLLIAADTLFPLASVFKVPLLIEIYRQVAAGDLALDEEVVVEEARKSPGSGVIKELRAGARLSLRDLATLMIIVSDNTATDMLLERVGGAAQVTRTMRALGLERTTVVKDCRRLLLAAVGLDEGDLSPANLREATARLHRGGYAPSSQALTADPAHNNVGTPRELMELFTMVDQRTILDPDSCAQIVDILSRQQLAHRLPMLLPPGVHAAHKTGTVGGTRNDAGIIYLADDDPVVFCALTQGVGADPQQALAADLAIAKAARAVCDHYLDGA